MRSNKIMNKRGALTSSFSYFDSDYRRDIFLRALERRHEEGKINKKDFIKYKHRLLSEIKGIKGFFKKFEFGLQKIPMLFH